MKTPLCLAFLLLVGGWCRAGEVLERDALPETVVPLSVVQTWGDLIAQKPVILHDSPDGKKACSFRIGIDRTEAKLHGGVVVYALGEGDSGLLTHRAAELALGPFCVDVLRTDKTATATEDVRMALRSPAPLGTGHPYVFFRQSIPLPETGSYTITVWLEEGMRHRISATAEVTVSSEPAVLWSPLDDAPWDEAKDNAVDDDAETSATRVCNSSSGAGLPQCDGGEAFYLDKLPEAKALLPEWIPTKPDGGLKLTVKGDDLIVKLDEMISTLYPNDHFLVRWWVNGKAFQPKTELPSRPAWNHSGAATQAKAARFRMEFHPEVMGVKKGDRVGVQLLYCPDGWDYLAPGPLQDAHAMPSREEPEATASGAISRLTNRVEFIYSAL